MVRTIFSQYLLSIIVCYSTTAQTPVPDTLSVQNSSKNPQRTSALPSESRVRKLARATRIAGESPTIDGNLGDPAWSQGEALSDFVQREPREGADPTEKTEVIFLFDDDALYVGARMYDKNPAALRAGATRRDELGFAEALKVSLDTYLDRKTAFNFGVSVAGVRRDFYNPIDDEVKQRDAGYNPVWEAKALIDSLGWIAEMRIPFSQLRFNDKEHYVWGMNLNRYIPARNEDLYWALRKNREAGWSSVFGDLVGISNIRPTSRVEALPYLASEATLRGAPNAQNPFDSGHNIVTRIGGDIKMGLGPHMTLDATVNPDFGQVEADPAVVNLTAFETVFAERRPFFVEGNRLLSNTGQAYFYSRRIGAPPHGTISGSFVDVPTNSTILGAAKTSGRFNSGLSIAALSALTGKETARSYNLSSGLESSAEVEPTTVYGAVRAEQEFGKEVSTAGAVLTSVYRPMDASNPMLQLLVRNALTGGGNFNLRFDSGTYELTGDAGFSYVKGDPQAIRRVQSSSARYFQRPDAIYEHLDTTRTSLSGYTATLALNKNAGDTWLWGLSLSTKSPGFELNDFGQLSTADNLDFSANVHYRDVVPSEFYHSYDIGLTLKSGWNYEGIRKLASADFSARYTWKNFWRTTLGGSYAPRVLSDNLTRGGPLMAKPSTQAVSFSVASGVTARTALSLNLSTGRDELGGWSYSVSGAVAPKPGQVWEFSVTPLYERLVSSRQYVSTLSDGRPETYSKRYIFAFIERSTLSLQFRLTYNFDPDISLELYAEPFAASGRYFDFGELRSAGALELRSYGTDGTAFVRKADGSAQVTDGTKSFTISNRDFNVRSFRSNLVFRWEWRLGSTLYLVWQQNRMNSSPTGELVNPSGLWQTIETVGDNIVALKISYWLSVD